MVISIHYILDVSSETFIHLFILSVGYLGYFIAHKATCSFKFSLSKNTAKGKTYVKGQKVNEAPVYHSYCNVTAKQILVLYLVYFYLINEILYKLHY